MAEEKKSEKKEAAPKEAPKKETSKKPASKRTWLFCGLGCCLGLIILGIIFSFLPFVSGLLTFRGQELPIPTFTPSPTSTTTAAPTTRYTTTPSQSFPEPASCSALQAPNASLLSISTTSPGLKEKTDTYYYKIYGSTETDLRNQMRDCGPKSDGQAYDAVTNYNINWQYNYRSFAGGCRIQDAAVGVKVDFYYPQWQTPSEFESGFDQIWQGYMEKLGIHEEGHRQLALEAGQTILDGLSNTTAATCDEALTTADDFANGTFNSYEAQQKEYDNRTNHGTTQGAQFP